MRISIITSSILLAVSSCSGFVVQQRLSVRASLVHMAINSDRAHLERSFEQMMGNDWREFRAKLVTREREGTETLKTRNYQVNRRHDRSMWSTEHKFMRQPEEVCDSFNGAVHSYSYRHQRHNPNQSRSKWNHGINGRSMGQNSFRDTASMSTSSALASFIDSSVLASTEDPFVSVAELPCHIKSMTKFDKHRWAHDIPLVETGCVLIANERLGGVFYQTVILIVQHKEQVGTMGMIINRPFYSDLLKIDAEQESKLDVSLKHAFRTSRVSYGGPAYSDEYSILHGFGQVEGSTKVCPGVYVGGAEELRNQVCLKRFNPSNALLVKGHIDWTPEELQDELQQGMWYIASVSSDFILRHAGAPITEDDNPRDLWTDILLGIGGKYAEVAKKNKGYGDWQMF